MRITNPLPTHKRQQVYAPTLARRLYEIADPQRKKILGSRLLLATVEFLASISGISASALPSFSLLSSVGRLRIHFMRNLLCNQHYIHRTAQVQRFLDYLTKFSISFRPALSHLQDHPFVFVRCFGMGFFLVCLLLVAGCKLIERTTARGYNAVLGNACTELGQKLVSFTEAH